MDSPRHPTTIQNLPCEVLSEIFNRLLAKQLAQMRSVCKPWNALLSDSYFVKSHLHHSIQNNDEILLFFDVMFSLEVSPTPFTARLSHSPDLELANFIKPPVFPICEYGSGDLIGSVNGLICFFYGSSRDGIVLHIWNPSLSAMLTLPPSSLPSDQVHFGFGFDPKTDEYKVLKLTTLSEPPNKVVQGEVYSVRKGSWKPISQSLPSHITIPEDHNIQICVHNHLHWIGTTDSKWKPETIVAFDFGAEAFREIPLPDSILNPDEDRLNVVGVLSGKLCVMSCGRYGGECEVWVMDEYGVHDSWAKHHAFSQFSGDIIPYGFTSHNQFLFQVGYYDCFGLYDPVATKTKTFKMMSRNSSLMKFVEYIDSLVWVAPPQL